MNRLFQLKWEHMFPTFPFHAFTHERHYRIAAFRLPYPGWEWLPVPSLEVYQWIETGMVLIAILFTLGIRTRITGPLTAVAYAYIFLLSQFSYHHGDFALLIALWCLAFAPGNAAHFNIEKIFFTCKNTMTAPVTAVRLLQVLCSTIFTFGALHKMNNGWLEGSVLEILWKRDMLRGWVAEFMATYELFHVGGMLMIASLLFAGLGVWHTRTRRAALLMGIATQVAIDISFWNALTFNYLMIVLLLSFVKAEDMLLIRNIMRGTAPAR